MLITTREARANFSHYLNEVEKGASVVISRRGHSNITLVDSEEFQRLINFERNLKAKLFDLLLSKSPDEVNEMHDLLCDLMGADTITNPEVLDSIKSAESGDTEEWVMP
ncbi:MAG: type II toxin-antitoxin system Phd/YefM family antitoxin [Cyanobacteria bacterium P01_F01_bin.143]